MKHTPRQIQGFTLVEVIAAIVLIGIVAAAFIPFIGTSPIYSADPVNIARSQAEAEQQMEQITADYVRQLNTGPGTCLQNLCTSYAANATLRYIQFDANGTVILENTCGGTPTNTLRVTVSPAAGQPITALFTASRLANDAAMKY